jgi:hypothetical protein
MPPPFFPWQTVGINDQRHSDIATIINALGKITIWKADDTLMELLVGA